MVYSFLSKRRLASLFRKKRISPTVIQQDLNASAFMRAPDEILVYILQELDCKSLLRCSETCKVIHSLVNTVSELRYVVALAAEGLVEEQPDAVASSERLKRLLDRRERWRTLDWNNCDNIRLQNGHNPRYSDPSAYIAFVDGAIVTTAYNNRNEVTALTVSFPPKQGKAANKIGVIDLAIALLDNPFSPPTPDLILDPVQQVLVRPALDLLILVTVSLRAPGQAFVDLHLRSLKSAGRLVHPRCTFAVIRDTNACILEGSTPLLRALGDLIALHVAHDGDSHIAVWNWVTGEKIAEIRDTFTNVRLYDFSFISPDLLLATVSAESFKRDTNTPRCAMVWIYDLNASRTHTDHNTLEATVAHPLVLCLPMFSNNVVAVTSFKCLSDTPAGSSSADGHSVSASRPVVLNLVTTVPKQDKLNDTARSVMVVHGQVFTSLLRTHTIPGSSPSVITLPWEKWGPEHTRLFKPIWTTWGHMGMMGNGRIVKPVKLFPSEEPAVLDFQTGRYNSRELVTKPSTFYSPVFKHRITTRLPYYVIPMLNANIARFIGRIEYLIDDTHITRCSFNPFESHLDISILEL